MATPAACIALPHGSCLLRTAQGRGKQGSEEWTVIRNLAAERLVQDPQVDPRRGPTPVPQPSSSETESWWLPEAVDLVSPQTTGPAGWVRLGWWATNPWAGQGWLCPLTRCPGDQWSPLRTIGGWRLSSERLKPTFCRVSRPAGRVTTPQLGTREWSPGRGLNPRPLPCQESEARRCAPEFGAPSRTCPVMCS